MLEQWKKLDRELQCQKTLMAACLRCLVGKKMIYRKGNMCVAKPCIVIDVWQGGDAVRIMTERGTKRWLHPTDIFEVE